MAQKYVTLVAMLYVSLKPFKLCVDVVCVAAAVVAGLCAITISPAAVSACSRPAMDCSFPILVTNPKTGIPMRVPCGRCIPCMERRQDEWSFRIQQEVLNSPGRCVFVTLTYADEFLRYGDWRPTLVKKDLQDFLKRLRKALPERKIRYFACGEYGVHPETGVDPRPHYHLILFNMPEDGDMIQDLLAKTWKFGFTTFDDVTRSRCRYVAKYCIKPKNDEFSDIQRPFALMSLKPAIGSEYVNTHAAFHRKNKVFYVVDSKSVKYPLPRYYKDRFFSKSTRKAYADKCSFEAELRLNREKRQLRFGSDIERESTVLYRRFKDRRALERISYKRLYEKYEL